VSDVLESVETNPRRSTGAQLDEVFRTAPPLSLETLINGGGREIDVEARSVYNDEHWRGFFPAHHVVSLVNRFVPLPVGFHKRFWTEGGTLLGETTDADEVIVGRNRIRLVEHLGRPYGLLTYTDLVYRPFYDLLLPVSEDLVVGKAFLGRFPYGIELVTFGMTRRYDFEFLTPADHRQLWAEGTAPEPEAIEGAWDLRLISNVGMTYPLYELEFERTEYWLDGRYEAFDAFSDDVRIHFEERQLELFDITNWHDEIRQVGDDLVIGKYCQTETRIIRGPERGSLGYVHAETQDGGDPRLCLYYVLIPRERPISEP
jgi:hypothetical protein